MYSFFIWTLQKIVYYNLDLKFTSFMGLGYHQFLKYIYTYFHLRMIVSP